MMFADKLIRLRKKAGWSQEELAARLHVSRQAVSKWEGAQSVPDLEKIVRLSELFGVSTDYLLKDEVGAEAFLAGEDGSAGRRSVSMEEANAFLEVKEQTADRIAGGVFLCIVSPIALMLLGAMSESGAYGISDTAAGMIGLIVLLVLVAVAVASFIFCGSRSEPYEYLEKEVFETESGVERMVRERKAQYRRTYTRNVVTGVCLCILAMVPFFAGAIVHEEEDVWMVALFCLAIVIVAVGVVLLVRVGIRWESFQKLLQEGDYTREKKEKDAKVHLATLIYWSVVTALYLVISLPSRDWQRTWIVWVIAAVLYPVLLAVLRLFADKHEK